MNAQRVTLAGSVVGGILASLCCIGPLVFALLGISGAAFAQRFEPWRPYLLVATYGLLGGAFYSTYKPARPECGPGAACEMPRASRLGKAMLWIAALIVLLATTFPILRLPVLRRQAMKKVALVLAAGAFGLASIGWAGEASKTTLSIKGMTCGGCVAAVKLQLKRTEGVSAYDVSLDKAQADVTYDPASTDPKKIAESVSRTGFEARVKEPAESGKQK